MEAARVDPADAEHPEDEVNAPFGFKADGTPKRGPGGRPSGTTKRARNLTGPRANTRPGNSAVTPPAPSRKAASSAKPKAGVPDYRESITQLTHLIATPMLAQNKSAVWKLNGMAFILCADDVATGVQQFLNLKPEAAAAADKLLEIGPWGAVLAPFAKLGAQLATNHGAIPEQAARALGAVSAVELQAAVVERMQAEASARAEAEAAVAAAMADAAGSDDE